MKHNLPTTPLQNLQNNFKCVTRVKSKNGNGKNGNGTNSNRKIGQREKSATKNKRAGK